MGVWGLEVLWFSVAKLEIKVHRVSLFFPFLISLRVSEILYCGNILAICYSRDCPGVLFVCWFDRPGLSIWLCHLLLINLSGLWFLLIGEALCELTEKMSTEPSTLQVLGDSSAIRSYNNNNYYYKCYSALLIEVDQNEL